MRQICTRRAEALKEAAYILLLPRCARDGGRAGAALCVETNTQDPLNPPPLVL
jgi:hypothetical protein